MRRLFATILALFCVAAAPAGAQQVHAIVIANTKAANIAAGIEANYKLITTFMAGVASKGEIDVVQHYVSGDDFSCERIVKEVQDLKLGQDDTVFFYYAGHGYRFGDTPTKFPNFDCARPGDTTAPVVGMSWVVKTLSDKHPRFLLAIADTCNVLIEKPPPVEVRALPTILRDALRRLFLRYRGHLIMSGSAPGDPSWYRTDEQAGGLFTRQFYDALLDTLEAAGKAGDPEKARWSMVADWASRLIVGNETHKQQPQVDRELSVSPPPS